MASETARAPSSIAATARTGGVPLLVTARPEGSRSGGGAGPGVKLTVVADLRSCGQPIQLAYALICHATVLRALCDNVAFAGTIAEPRATLDSCSDSGVRCERPRALERPQKTREPSADKELSARELVILRMLSGPLSERDIGRELYVAHSTIHSHTKSIYRKLRVSSRSEAVSLGRELRLI